MATQDATYKAKHMAKFALANNTSNYKQSENLRRSVPKGLAAIFLLLCVVGLFSLCVCTPFRGGVVLAEKTEGQSFPQLVDEDGLNTRFLSQLGDWFGQSFAFRSELLDIDASLKERFFMTSSIDQVVVGKEGWLYYAGELNDWRGANAMSDGSVANAAHNLRLVQDALAARGKSFVVTIAPNKSSLYPQYMPDWLLNSKNPSNAQRLGAALREKEVNYLDLFELLSTAHSQQAGLPLYLRRDSHWTSEGAKIAAEALLDTLEHPHEDWASLNVEMGELGVGDLDDMLHPAWARPEEQLDFLAYQQFSWIGDSSSVEDSASQTQGPANAQGSLLCLRDSFGNALLPWLASSFAQARFSKLVPYDLSDATLSTVDCVVIERAERHVSSFASEPPYLSAPELAHPLIPTQALSSEQRKGEKNPEETLVQITKNGPYLQIEGSVDETQCPAGTPVYVTLQLADSSYCSYHSFRLSGSSETYHDRASDDEQQAGIIQGDNGFKAYLELERFSHSEPVALYVCTFDAEAPTLLYQQALVWSEL